MYKNIIDYFYCKQVGGRLTTYFVFSCNIPTFAAIITEITYNVQQNLFDTVDREKRERLMNAIDSINGKHGHSVKLAVQGQGTGWKLKQEQLSKHYTTDLGEIIEINCKK